MLYEGKDKDLSVSKVNRRELTQICLAFEDLSSFGSYRESRNPEVIGLSMRASL